MTRKEGRKERVIQERTPDVASSQDNYINM